MANRIIMMTNGDHVVPVVRSAFDRVWSKRGFIEAPPELEQTPHVLGLEPHEKIQDWRERTAATKEEAKTAAEELRARVDEQVRARAEELGVTLGELAKPAEDAGGEPPAAEQPSLRSTGRTSGAGVTGTGDSSQSTTPPVS